MAPTPAVDFDDAPAAGLAPVKAAAGAGSAAAKEAAPVETPPEASKKAAAHGPAVQAHADDDDAPPASHRTPAREPTQESGEFSLSSEFFRKDEESVPPVDAPLGHDHSHDHDHDHDHDDLHAHIVLSPETIARRARLRRVVGGLVAAAGVIAAIAIGKGLLSNAKAPSETQPTKLTVVAESNHPEPAKQAEAKQPEAKAPEPVAAKAPEPAAAESAAAPVESAKAAEPAAEAPKPAGDIEALKKQTLALLNQGKRDAAIATARQAIEVDPADALPYLYLGSALQESGKWKEGMEAYNECVRKATKGSVFECRAMGGKK